MLLICFIFIITSSNSSSSAEQALNIWYVHLSSVQKIDNTALALLVGDTAYFFILLCFGNYLWGTYDRLTARLFTNRSDTYRFAWCWWVSILWIRDVSTWRYYHSPWNYSWLLLQVACVIRMYKDFLIFALFRFNDEGFSPLRLG